ncbi:GNAT family N-acetyltransferase [Flindersiella endophytica]
MTIADSPDRLRIVPANQASWDDLQAVFSTGEGRQCQCQFFKLTDEEWRSSVGFDERAGRFRAQTNCGDKHARSTSGLVAYCGVEPAGWCAVEPRTAYPRLLRMRVPWTGRDENKADEDVWAVTCFVVRRGYRRRGIGSAMARAAVEFARERGARAVEGYPVVKWSGHGTGAIELYVGSVSLFTAAGFREVGRPTARRAVVRVEF